MKPALVVQAALTLICLHATACGQTQLQESDRAVIAFDFQIQKFTESARSNGIELVELLEIKLPGLLSDVLVKTIGFSNLAALGRGAELVFSLWRYLEGTPPGNLFLATVHVIPKPSEAA